MKRIIAFFSVLLICFSCMAFSVSAAPAQSASTYALASDGILTWEFTSDGVLYKYEAFFGAYASGGRYKKDMVVPMYYCSDGISTMFFATEYSLNLNTYKRALIVQKTDPDGNTTVTNTFDCSTFENEINSGWYTSLPNTTFMYGLSFTDVDSMKKTLDPNATSLYYVEDEYADLSTAVNFFDVSSGSGDSDNSGFLQGIWDAIVNLGETIGGFFTSLWENIKGLFVPDEDFMDGVMAEVKEANSNSDFIMMVWYFMDDIRDFVNEDFTVPPSISVSLDDADSDINYGTGDVSIFNVSWFAKYRKYTDPFLSALFWFFFVWALVKNLPNILNGAGIVIDSPASVAETAYTMREGKERKQEANDRRAYWARRNGRGG